MQRVIISPDVFIWTQGTTGIIYDSRARHGFRFINSIALSYLIDEVQKPDNLYSVPLSNSLNLSDPDVRFFIDRIVAEGYAKVLDDRECNILSLKPILRIQDNVNYYRWLNRQGIDGEIINNIRNIIVNLGGRIRM